MATELLEKLVTQWLMEADVVFLTEVCTEFNVNIPDAKVGNKQYLIRLITRHLYSEELEASDDGGQAVWFKLFADLGNVLGKGAPKNEAADPVVAPPQGGDVNNVGLANGGGAQAAATVGSTQGSLSFHKLREFKINGTVDGGKEGTLQYVSLQSQIKLGIAAQYTTAEIIYGVIRAIPAASSFRTLLETNLDMDMGEFVKLLRSHFKEQDSDSALLELKNCFQQANQGAHDFCCRAIFLRDRLEAIAGEEGSPWSEEKLRKRLFRTIATGLKHSSIKLELQPYLSELSTLSNREFLEKVAQAEVHEEERLGKVKAKEAEIAALLTSKKSSTSNNASTRPDASAKAAKSAAAAAGPEWSPEIRDFMTSVSSLTAKLDQLSSHASVQSERIQTLEKMLSDPSTPFRNPISPGSRSGNGNNNSVRRIFKCTNCITQNIGYCKHCFKCGSESHKVKDCPEN